MKSKTYSINDLIKIKKKVERISYCFLRTMPSNRCLEVDDLSQEALIRVCSVFKNKSFLSQQEINAIAKNAIINACKHYIKESKHGGHMSMEDIRDRLSGHPLSLDYDESILREINELIDALPKKTKDIVRAAFEEDVTIIELARRMKITRQTAAKRLDEGKKSIVKNMKKKHPLM